MYKDTVQSVDAKLMESITKDYKSDEIKVNEINTEAAEIAKSFPTSKDQTLADRIDVLDRNEAFITFKDTKEGFPGRIQTRLINRSKSNIGIISKVILDRINQNLRTKTGLNQWKSSQDVLSWFNNLQDKQNYTFLKLDIVSFYPSITEELLLDAINWAKTFTPITNDESKIIIHSRKSLLFYKKKPWIKKDNPNFDVTQGSNDGAEISEIVGLYLLDGLKRYIKKEQQGIYRDDLLAIVKLSGPQIERLRKNLFKFFESKKLKITIEANITETDFLDISFDLNSGIHKPYRKDDNIPSYINKHSNHPTHIKNNLPTMISKRISMLSSNEQVFNQEAYIYNEGLKQAGYDDKIQYIPPTVGNNRVNRKRKRNVIYFCPPWNDALKTNLGKKFLALIDKHFKKNTFLGKLFNRNTVKLSYSTTKNIKSIITSHNNKLINPVERTNDRLCNCVGFQCPVNGECLKSDLVYSCKVESANEVKEYIGSTKNSFKVRWNAHNSDARYISKRTKTTLAD